MCNSVSIANTLECVYSMIRKFILCIGASKSGTTWLYHYLINLPETAIGFRKEYAALNVIFSRPSISIIKPNIVVRSALSAKSAILQAQQQRMCRSITDYCDYFDEITPQNGLSLDISPQYLALTTDDLNFVVQEMSSRNFQTHIVLLLRDPVNRILSYSKMSLRNRFLREKLQLNKFSTVMDAANSLLNSSQFNTDYISAILNVERASHVAEKFIYPYESLISATGIGALSSSLNIKNLTGFQDYRFNQSKSANEERCNTQLNNLKLALHPQYLWCRSYFEAKGVSLDWPNYG